MWPAHFHPRAYGWQPDAPYGTTPLWQAEVSGPTWQFHYLQTDHLDTPKLATNAQGQITWQAHSEAFGQTTPDPNSTITVNLRFPGQYYDEESGLHYNYFRDYDPATGRYVQSDPIGLEGRVNIYNYIGQNPFGKIDYFGLSEGDFERIHPPEGPEQKKPTCPPDDCRRKCLQEIFNQSIDFFTVMVDPEFVRMHFMKSGSTTRVGIIYTSLLLL